MSRQTKLLEAHALLTAAISSSENWEKSYTDSPGTFRRLVEQEATLQAAAIGYLLGLRQRVPRLINWDDIELKPINAAVTPPENSEIWAAERIQLEVVLTDRILELMVVGANAGEDLYSRPLSITALDEFVLRAADQHTAALVSEITKTTRRYIQQSVQQSIRLGENASQLIERIQKRVTNPVRAEMIARTESVNAYQRGLDLFAEESGAISSTWDALSGACRLCSPLNGVTKKIGESFVLANGREVTRPPGHTNCRCGRILNYAE